MLDTRTTEWLSRLQAKGPSFVAWVLAALIAVELARVAVALVNGPVKSPQPVVAPTAPRPNVGVNIQGVVSAHLFGVAVADPSTQDPNNAPLSSANLVLAGTIATDNPKKGFAIISDGGPSKVFSVGDNVNGASLYSVYLDHVILDRGGNLETLLLPRQFNGGPKTPPRRVAAVAEVHAARTVQDIKHMVQQNPSILDQVMRTVPSFDSAAGKLRGFRAYPGRNRALFSELGLRAGDLVTAINGQPLDDAQHSQEVINTIQTASNVSVTIERGGNRQDINLNIADIAAQAAKQLEGGENSGGAGGAPAGAPQGVAPGAPPPAPADAVAPPPQPNPSETPNE
jgi:general secretion pathway protein C